MMMIRFVVLFLLLKATTSSAWLVSIYKQQQPPITGTTRLFTSKDPNSLPDETQSQPSRREWFRGISEKVAMGLGLSSSLSGGGQMMANTPPANAALPPIVTSKSVCDPSVSVWKRDNERLVYLLGTAHISEVSAALAGSLIQETHPNAVFVELDLKRVGGIVRMNRNTKNAPALPAAEATTEAAEDTLTSAAPAGSPLTQIVVPAVASTAQAVLASPMTSDEGLLDAAPPPPPSPEPRGLSGWIQRKAFNFASNAVGKALKGMYSNLNEAGFNPGEEFATAIREGQKIGAAIVLGDQDVEYTLRRLTAALAATDLDKLLNPDAEFERSMQELLPGGPDSLQPEAKNYDDPAEFKKDLTEYVERLKSRDSVRKIMRQLNEVAPALVQVMLTERDAYMATGLDTLNQFECIVAVMGIAHQDGVEQNLRQKGWQQVRLRCP